MEENIHKGRIYYCSRKIQKKFLEGIVYEIFKISSRRLVATIIIESPPANALSSHLLAELADVFQDIESNDEIRVVLIYGEGRFFSAGADIKEFTELEKGSGFDQLAKSGQKLFERMETFPKPIIAAIHGGALGGGLELAMACHIRLVAKMQSLVYQNCN